MDDLVGMILLLFLGIFIVSMIYAAISVMGNGGQGVLIGAALLVGMASAFFKKK